MPPVIPVAPNLPGIPHHAPLPGAPVVPGAVNPNPRLAADGGPDLRGRPEPLRRRTVTDHLVPAPIDTPTRPDGSSALGKANALVPAGSALSPAASAKIANGVAAVLSAKTKLAKHVPHAAELPKQSTLSKLLGGELDHVYLTADQYNTLAKRPGYVDGSPAKYPVFIDNKKNQLVINVDAALGADGALSAEALVGLDKALGPGAKLPATVDSAKKLLAKQAQPAPPPPPPYAGNRISADIKDLAFFAPNDMGIPGIEDWAQKNKGAYSRPNYFKAPAADNQAHTEVIAHRGLVDIRKGIPENSLAAMENAYRNGHLGVELDVQITRDGKPVLMHDFTAGRMTNDKQNRLVSDLDSADITQRPLVIRNPASGDFVETDQKVPMVKDVLAQAVGKMPGMAVTLDCKENAAEPLIALLIDNPKLRESTAVKLYSEIYRGGFDQLLGNLQKHYGIHPTDPADRSRRKDLLADLKEINLVPILAQENLKDVQGFFPPPEGQTRTSPAALADSGRAWLGSWQAMKPVVLEAVPTSNDAQGKAMGLIREKLRDPSDSLSALPQSASYRANDFSAEQKDGSSKYFWWTNYGGIKEVPDTPINRARDTPGALKGDNLLTDEPLRQAYAVAHDTELPRGHTGYKLALAPGTEINTALNAGNIKAQTGNFLREKQKPDEDLISQVAKGRLADGAGRARPPAPDASSSRPGRSGLGWVVAGGAAVVAGGLAAAGEENRRRIAQTLRNSVFGETPHRDD